MLTIHLVRHGETVENRLGLLQGVSPGHLSELGREQALALAARLRGERFGVVVSSPLARAVATARIITPPSFAGEMELCPLLRERDWGTLTLTPCAEARKLAEFPPDVETLESGMARAAEFLRLMLRRHDGKRILAVGHGFINRCVLAAALGTDRSRVARMENAECRVVTVSAGDQLRLAAGEDEASAD